MDSEKFVITKQDGSCLSSQEVEAVYDYLAVYLMKKGYTIRGGDVGRLNSERQMEKPLVNTNCEECDD